MILTEREHQAYTRVFMEGLSELTDKWLHVLPLWQAREQLLGLVDGN